MFRRHPISRALATLLTIALAGCAGATSNSRVGGPPLQTLSTGVTVTAALGANDPALEDGSRYHLYAFDGEAGEEVELRMESDAFDTFLSLGQYAGGALKILQSDDDAAGDLNSMLRLTLPRTGRYVVRANAFDAADEGEYRLSFISRGVIPAPSRSTIRPGEIHAGDLGPGDAWLPDGSFYDLWILEGQPGERVRIDLMSEHVDAFVMLGEETDTGFDVMRADDDGGEGTNARITAILPPSGRVLVGAGSFFEDEAGAYRISATSLGLPRSAAPMTVTIGQTVTGVLEHDDPISERGTYHDLYAFHAVPGDTLAIELSTSEFDAYLTLERREGDAFVEIDSDDDSGGGLDSRIVHIVTRVGEYFIRAQSYSPDATGSYTLFIDRVRMVEPTRTAVAIGGTHAGRLDRSDARHERGGFYDIWTFSGNAGDRVRIDLRSDDFDAYLLLGSEESGEFVEFARNDDGDGTNARIEAILPHSGEFVVHATSFWGAEEGAYTISLARGSS